PVAPGEEHGHEDVAMPPVAPGEEHGHEDVAMPPVAPSEEHGHEDVAMPPVAPGEEHGHEDVAMPPAVPPGRGESPVASQVERLRRFYEPIFADLYENPVIRLRDLEQLGQIAAGYRSRSRFITDLTLDPPQATADLAQPPFLEEDFLILSTIHSAKGCEWDAVYILHAADGMIPSDMAVGDEDGVDEERRLLYVAMTRARNWLYVYFPLRYYHQRFGLGDAHGYAQLSRYLSGPVQRFFEARAAYHDFPEEVPTGTAGLANVQAWVKHLLNE
ncbi:MAG: 3'-5' exonuclease, partial [Planctomycetota bacterium]